MSDPPSGRGTEETSESVTAPTGPDRDRSDAIGETSAAEPDGPPAPASVPGERIGRYVVLAPLGAGAMGVVLAAYDPELDRKVAVKLLKAHGDGPRARTRLQREAQALAKLNHPNVCAVHDVGLHHGQVFVAMEFVDGETLTDWMRTGEKQRPWRAVLQRFDEAGRGLAAAHGSGLVHRDFKPDNVMIGNDGRVRVMDFGLARIDGDSTAPQAIVADEHASESVRLTRTGALLGTPAYMAAEQFSGIPADARSDQFAFCVALHEALYGVRPFRGGTVAALMVSVLDGAIDDPPRGSSVPAWVRAVILRGLRVAPAERWADMDSLLATLRADPGARRRRWAGWGLGSAAFVGLAYTAAAKPDAIPAAAVCTGMDEPVRGLWDDARRAQVREAFEATGLVYARDTGARVVEGVDRYLTRWTEGRTDACEATHVRGEQSDGMLDRRMACYGRALESVRASVEIFAAADEPLVAKATMMVDQLPRLAACADAEALERAVPPPEDPATAARVLELETVLADVKARLDAGRTNDARDRLAPVFDEAHELGYRPLEVQANLLRAKVHENETEYEDARRLFETAYRGAVELRMVDESAGAATGLVAVLGSRMARPDEGRAWALHAESFALATGDPGFVANATANLGQVEYVAGDYDKALALMKRGLDARVQRYGARSPWVAASCNNLGLVSEARGELDEASAYYERALDIWTESLGPEHPLVAGLIGNMGNVHYYRAQWDAAAQNYQRSIDLKIKLNGPDSGSLAWPYSNLGAALLGKGDYTAALVPSERALAIRLKTLGEEHPDVGTSYENIGLIHDGLGDHAKAIELYQKSVAIRAAALGDDHPDVAFGLANLGASELLRGDAQAAHDQYIRAAAIWRDKLGADHLNVALAETGIGAALLDLGAAQRAIAPLEHALELREAAADSIEPVELANTRFQLARALWETRRDRDRARELAEEAKPALDAGGPAVHRERDQVAAWLAERDG